MIINRLKLDPFAGMTNRDVIFDRGLNVILGPNEAGKSTLLNALSMALFMPTLYGKRQFVNDIRHFIPSEIPQKLLLCNHVTKQAYVTYAAQFGQVLP